MKKILIITLILFGITGIIYASDSRLSNNEYINTLNNSIGEMNTCISDEGDLSDLIFNVKNGYLKKSIISIEDRIECYSSFYDSFKDTRVKDIKLQEKHNELMSYYNSVSKVLIDMNKANKELLEKDLGGFSTFKELLEIERNYSDKIDSLSNKANIVYDDIQKFWID